MERPPAAVIAPTDRDEKLRRMTLKVQAAFGRFQASRELRDLDPVIIAILEDFIPRKTERPLATYSGDTRLMGDLGFDSLAINCEKTSRRTNILFDEWRFAN